MENREIDFIARHYRRGLFLPARGWRRLGIGPSAALRRLRVAAAAALVVALSAAAAVFYSDYRAEQPPVQGNDTMTASPLTVVKVIDFENAPLPDVIAEIESVYGVKVENLPERPEEFELSLHYEGTPADLITVINDILGTRLTVAEK